MKRNAFLLTIVLASVVLLWAQENAPKEMTGWVCSSACVTHSGGLAACDANCAASDKSGDTVFVDETGKVIKISNPDMVKGKMGQKLTMKCQMSKDKESMEIQELIQAIR